MTSAPENLSQPQVGSRAGNFMTSCPTLRPEAGGGREAACSPWPLWKTNGGPGSLGPRGPTRGLANFPGPKLACFSTKRWQGARWGLLRKQHPPLCRCPPPPPLLLARETHPVSAPTRGSSRRGYGGGRRTRRASTVRNGDCSREAAHHTARLKPRASPGRSPLHHRTWNHPPCQTSWPEDGRGEGRGPAAGGGTRNGPFSHNPARHCPMRLRSARNSLPRAPRPPPARGARTPIRAAPPPPASSPC